ncbi:MAG: polysaccharide deacetylase family protein [Cytophagaceae bacterium]|nr:polysaccharide deacetylase family protein [Cytophagaceae bacterium]
MRYYLILFFCLPTICVAQIQSARGAILRGDIKKKEIAIVFTGHEFTDGGKFISKTLKEEKIKASFFFTGDFYRNGNFGSLIKKRKKSGHYLGAHSDKHLLYCPWENRDSLLVSKKDFLSDLNKNYGEMARFGIKKSDAKFFLPPYEWYNETISLWTEEAGLKLINFTSGTLSNADYTTAEMKNYKNSEVIYNSIIDYERKNTLNGFILLIHIGTAPERTDKFYLRLPELIKDLKRKGYEFRRVDELLKK